jgi:hypothetical protein
VLRVDTKTKRVTLVRSYRHPKKLLAPFEGNAQFLPDGHIFVGWGAWPYVSELDAKGHLLFDAYFGHGKKPGQDADTYRAYRFVWRGKPKDPPALAVVGNTAYVSWNGATDVTRWRLLKGNANDDMAVVGSTRKVGFETAIPLRPGGKFIAVEALDAKGNVIGTSVTIERKVG